MGKEARVINKIKRLIRSAGYPRWLHHYKPKKYELVHHLIALIVRQECKLSYRRVSRLFNDAEKLHQWCANSGIKCCIRDKGTPRFKKHTLRRKNQRFLHPKRYHRREIAEAIIKAIKQKPSPIM